MTAHTSAKLSCNLLIQTDNQPLAICLFFELAARQESTTQQVKSMRSKSTGNQPSSDVIQNVHQHNQSSKHLRVILPEFLADQSEPYHPQQEDLPLHPPSSPSFSSWPSFVSPLPSSCPSLPAGHLPCELLARSLQTPRGQTQRRQPV